MLHVVTTGAYYPPVVTTWKILTTEASQLTAGALCNVVEDVKLKEKDGGGHCESSRAKVRIFDCDELSQGKVLQIQMCLKTEPQEERD